MHYRRRAHSHPEEATAAANAAAARARGVGAVPPPDIMNGTLDILGVDFWQNCAFARLLGHRECCALACCSKALYALMQNEQIWKELFLASKRLPALTEVSHWKLAFKQRTLLGARWRMDTMVRSKATWRWFVSRCMKNQLRQRLGMAHCTLRVSPQTVADVLREAQAGAAEGGYGGRAGYGIGSLGGVTPVTVRPGGPAHPDVDEDVEMADAQAQHAQRQQHSDCASGASDGSGGTWAGGGGSGVGGSASRGKRAEGSGVSGGEVGCADGAALTGVLDASGLRVFSTIAEAIAAASPLDRIVIDPGEYHENLTVDKPLEIVGAEAITPVLVRGDCSAATFWLTASCRLTNLCLAQEAATADSPILATVLASGGTNVLIDECNITSSAGHAVVVKGPRTKATITHNTIHDSRGVGVLFCDESSGSLTDNTIYANKRAGVAILRGGSPLVAANMIRDGEDSGVLVSESGKGRIESNRICGNTRAGVAILQSGQPLVARNTIAQGRDSGVLVCECGEGTIEANLIVGNRIAGIAICSGAAPQLIGNRIGQGEGRSLCIAEGCRPHVEGNTLESDAELGTLSVPAPMRPLLAARNSLVDKVETWPPVPRAFTDAAGIGEPVPSTVLVGHAPVGGGSWHAPAGLHAGNGSPHGGAAGASGHAWRPGFPLLKVGARRPTT